MAEADGGAADDNSVDSASEEDSVCVDGPASHADSDSASEASAANGAHTVDDIDVAGEHDESGASAAARQVQLEAALERYRATLRNESETGNSGFSKDYYTAQKPPHWG